MSRLNRIRQTRYLPPLVLLLWGWVLVWSSVSARLDLLLNAVFHPVVAIAGVVLLVLGAIQLRSAYFECIFNEIISKMRRLVSFT